MSVSKEKRDSNQNKCLYASCSALVLVACLYQSPRSFALMKSWPVVYIGPMCHAPHLLYGTFSFVQKWRVFSSLSLAENILMQFRHWKHKHFLFVMFIAQWHTPSNIQKKRWNQPLYIGWPYTWKCIEWYWIHLILIIANVDH